MKTFVTILLLILNTAIAQEDGAYLDLPYKDLVHPKVEKKSNFKNLLRSNVEAVIAWQTSVKSQGSRGTCSIFSATAYLEALLVKKGEFTTDLDLSEEWLQYTAVRGNISDGSGAWRNFSSIRKHGMPLEETLPYNEEDWTESFNPLIETRCGHLLENKKKACLIVHRDPALMFLSDTDIMDTNGVYKDDEFVLARREAWQFLNAHILFTHSSYSINSVNMAKQLLEQGVPLVLEFDFYYGAWNHRRAETYGIGRNMDHWSKGIVSFPEAGSLDLKLSRKNPAGHSIVVVGYDDSRIVEKTINMQDGTTQTFKYKGVYYFKNSWGTESFGKDFEINGSNYPGYGMMVQKYAHELGAFYILPIK